MNFKFYQISVVRLEGAGTNQTSKWTFFACHLGCLIGSWYATKLGMYLLPHTKLNFQNLFDYD